MKSRLALILGGFVVALLAAETALCIAGYSYLNPYIVDDYVGASLRPGAQGWYRREGEAYIRINSDGLRDREHTREKPANTVRIAVLGDSYAEALQVPLENTFWTIMQNRLRECKSTAGQGVELINFGVSGFSTARELITLRHRVWQYSPDIILLAFCTGNDVRDNSRALAWQFSNIPLPYFVYRDGQLALDDSLLSARNNSSKYRLKKSIAGKSLNWLEDHVRLVGVAEQAMANAKDLREWWRWRKTLGVTLGKSRELGLNNQVYVEPKDPAWIDAWRVTEGLILLMHDEIESRGAKFMVVTLSNGIQVHPRPSVRQAFMEKMNVTDLYYPDTRIRTLCERAGIAVLSLAPPLQSYAERNSVILHGFGRGLGDGHWNSAGHRIAGELIAQKLCEQISNWRRESRRSDVFSHR